MNFLLRNRRLMNNSSIDKSENSLQRVEIETQKLEIDSNHAVAVAYSEGPHSFYLSFKARQQDQKDMMQRIYDERFKFKRKEYPSIGTICLAKISSGVICRALVHSIISKTECEVFLIDFGSKEIVSYEDIHEIPEGFLKPKAFVVNVYLDGFEDFNNSTEEWVKYFNEDTQKKDFLFHVKRPSEPGLLQCGDLYLKGSEGKYIDELKRMFPFCTITRYPEKSSTFTENATLLASVSDIKSCCSFHIQKQYNVATLNELMDKLNEEIDSAESFNTIRMLPGQACASQFVDERWYRAEVVRAGQYDVAEMLEVEVMYVDYGNKETVIYDPFNPDGMLREIDESYVKALEPQAIECKLVGFEEECDQQSKIFNELVFSKDVIVSVVEVQNDGLLVKLFDPKSGECIGSKIREMHESQQEKCSMENGVGMDYELNHVPGINH